MGRTTNGKRRTISRSQRYPGTAGEAGAGRFFESADARGKGCGGGIDAGRGSIFGGCLLDLGDQGGAYYGGVGQAAEDRDVAGERDAEADSDGKLCEGAGAARKMVSRCWAARMRR